MFNVLQLLEKLKEVIESCPELTFVGNPVLRTPAAETTLEEGLAIAERLKITLLKNRKITGYGRGLAAPQIGLAKRVFVTYIGDVFKVYINPQIIERSTNTNFYRELCLSSGCLWADVERPEWIVIRYMNENGESVEEKVEGFAARLLQHEEKHLNGIVNLDEAIAGSIEFISSDPLQEKLRSTYK